MNASPHSGAWLPFPQASLRRAVNCPPDTALALNSLPSCLTRHGILRHLPLRTQSLGLLHASLPMARLVLKE